MPADGDAPQDPTPGDSDGCQDSRYDQAGCSAEADTSNVFSGSAHSLAQVGRVYGDVIYHLPPVPSARRDIPHQIPANDRWFTNRRTELARLDTLFGSDGGPRIVLVTGARGVGKTALARRSASARTGWLAGGEVYVDFAELRSHFGAKAAVGEALANCLCDLGVPQALLPTSLSARTSLFRTRTAQVPMLVVLDDVTDPAQVRPLVPTAIGSVVVATCDRRIAELVSEDGAEVLIVDPLDEGHGRGLLADLCPQQVAEADPADVDALVRLCGGLPIALRVAASRLRTDRGLRVVDLLHEVDTGLEALSVEDGVSVAAVLTSAYQALPEGARQAYQVFGAAAGLELTAETVALALGVPLRAARTILSALVAANLVEEHPGRRYLWYPLVARHAAEQVSDEDAEFVKAALRRLVRHHLTHAMAADTIVMGQRLRYARLDDVLDGAPRPLAGATRAQALEWLADRGHDLLATARLAVRLGDDQAVWQLAEALAALYLNRRRPYDLVAVCDLGIEAAQRLGRAEIAARLQCVASRGHLDLGRLSVARQYLDAALAFAETAHDLRLLASVWEFRGRLADAEPDRTVAISAYTKSLEYNNAAGEVRGAAIARYFLGRVLDEAGHPDQALAHLSKAIPELRASHDERMVARVQLAAGLALSHLGQDHEGSVVLREAISVLDLHGLWHYEVQALEALAEVAGRLGDPREVRTCLTRAIAILDRSDAPEAQRLRAKLAASPEP